MYTKVGILIGAGDITQQEMTAPVGIHYKRRHVQPSREKLGRILREMFRVWLTSVGYASVSNTL